MQFRKNTTPNWPFFDFPALQKVWSEGPVAKSKVPSKKIDPEKHGFQPTFWIYFFSVVKKSRPQKALFSTFSQCIFFFRDPDFSRKTREFGPSKSLVRGAGREVEGPVEKNRSRKTRISAYFLDLFIFGREKVTSPKGPFFYFFAMYFFWSRPRLFPKNP